ncbi:hypothetical protein BUALT_Bualt12G0067300 [Buddleja alternifolia]|uniref:Transposase n=1 Tax=Buddleja alternifolia TaxID=168488 RepID=A0AAV6WPL9_9LAMI|nr:hypothetical protein BUALT_Bualt12G0067300 [Buddleja alternifolia]
MDECTEHEELFVLLEEILSHSQILLLALYRVYRARKRRRILLDHVGHRTYSLTVRVPKQLEILHDIISYTEEIYVDYLRMDRNAFGRLCYLLENVGGLISTKNVQIPEQVAYFLLVLAHHTKNRIVKNGFKRSGYTISKHFNAVLNAIIKLHPLLLTNPEPVPDDSTNDRWKWFKGCLGALDSTHIPIRVAITDKPRYRNRKGDIAMNILGVCDTNMKFVYILTSWKGSAADSRVLKDAVARVHGLKVPNGNYYLCDGGYTNCNGFLTPYRGVRTMAANSSRARKVPAREHTGKSKRVWSMAEEKVLVSDMKDLVARGYKADNGFKTGSSFTLNSTSYTIEVESDEAWDKFVKTDNNVRTMRYKSWPFYTHWRDIFGKDRATGENVEGFVEAIQGLFNKDTQIQFEDEHAHTPVFHPADCGGSRLFTSMTPGDSSATGKGKSSKKKKSIDDGDDRFIELFSVYCEKISGIAKRANEASNQRKAVFDALDVMKELGVEEKISVSKFLVNNTKDLERFFSLTEVNKNVMVKMIVEGRYRSG